MPMLLSDTGAASSVISSALTTTAASMQSAIGEVVPVALGVAGTILVCTLGWKLFRRFTK